MGIGARGIAVHMCHADAPVCPGNDYRIDSPDKSQILFILAHRAAD